MLGFMVPTTFLFPLALDISYQLPHSLGVVRPFCSIQTCVLLVQRLRLDFDACSRTMYVPLVAPSRLALASIYLEALSGSLVVVPIV